jgi:hypothetical protein
MGPALALSSFILAATPAAPSCRDLPEFKRLDFWLGDWDVFVGETRVGANRIEAILRGCAVVETWRDVDGGEGRSLFYFVPATATWTQVWVTDQATRPGGVKEKRLVKDHAGGVRFQGAIPLPGGGTYLDRTTLTANADGSVRQLIEISKDDGRTWTTAFDARYVKKGT